MKDIIYFNNDIDYWALSVIAGNRAEYFKIFQVKENFTFSLIVGIE